MEVHDSGLDKHHGDFEINPPSRESRSQKPKSPILNQINQRSYDKEKETNIQQRKRGKYKDLEEEQINDRIQRDDFKSSRFTQMEQLVFFQA